MVASMVKGIQTTLRQAKLVLLLWAWTLLLAVAAAWPARAWFSAALDRSVETEGLLTRFNVGTFADLSKYHEVGPFALLVASVVGTGFIALLGSAFTNGGTLEVLGSQGDTRTFMHRFFRGGGHFFWRFVRLALLAYLPGAILAGIVAAGMGAITSPLMDSEWEPAGAWWSFVNLVVVGLVALWFVLALDYARIGVARHGGRSMARAYATALRFVAQHLPATYAIGIAALAAVGALLVAYVAHETVWTTSTWLAIIVLVLAQQTLMLLRAGVRVAQVSAEWHYYGAAIPALAPVAAAPAGPVQDVAASLDTPPAPDAPPAPGAATPDAGPRPSA